MGGRPGRRDEGGLTLTELVITVAIMGIAFTGLLSAMMTIVQTSARDRDGAAAEAELRRFAELVRSAEYLDCPGMNPDDYIPAAAGEVLVRDIVSVQVWDGNVPATSDEPTFIECDAASFDPGLQRIQLQVSTAEGDTPVRELAVMKRKAAET